MNANRAAAHSAACTRVVNTLRRRGAFAFRVRGGLGMQAGLPDIVAALPPEGKLVAIEVKTGRGVVGPCQARVHAELREAGALVLTGDLESVTRELDRLLPDRQLSLDEALR